jgi:hypothetical protein
MKLEKTDNSLIISQSSLVIVVVCFEDPIQLPLKPFTVSSVPILRSMQPRHDLFPDVIVGGVGCLPIVFHVT